MKGLLLRVVLSFIVGGVLIVVGVPDVPVACAAFAWLAASQFAHFALVLVLLFVVRRQIVFAALDCWRCVVVTFAYLHLLIVGVA